MNMRLAFVLYQAVSTSASLVEYPPCRKDFRAHAAPERPCLLASLLQLLVPLRLVHGLEVHCVFEHMPALSPHKALLLSTQQHAVRAALTPEKAS